MKQLFTILLSLLVGITTHSQKDSIGGKQFQLTGIIKDTVQMTADCGLFAWGTVVEFEITNLVRMKYSQKTIGIIVTCPEFYGKGFFEKGKTYDVIFSNKNQSPFDWLIPNKDLLKKNHLSFDHYAISIKEIP